MAVDLGDLVESLQREVSPPGTDLFPDATDNDWVGHLNDAFWEAVLFGVISGYEENAAARGGDALFTEGIVVPTSYRDDSTYDDPDGYVNGTDLSRELQQLVVLYAGYRILLSEFRNINTMTRGKAGPVEFEVQKSAQTLREALMAIKAKIDRTIANLSTYGGSDVATIDSVIQKTYAIAMGDSWWVR